MRAKEKLTIPIDRIAEGVELCLKNSAQFCADAKMLCKASSCQHAFGLCLYAIEELGKAELIKDYSAFLKKRGKTNVVFSKMKAKDFFPLFSPKDLQKLGFSSKPINPFYDHRCKLFFARRVIGMAMENRLYRSLEGQKFHNLREILDAFDEKGKDVYELNLKKAGFRETAMYVDYNQKNDEWINGTVKITATKITELIGDIEEAIKLMSNILR